MGQGFNTRHFSGNITRSEKIFGWGVPITKIIAKTVSKTHGLAVLSGQSVSDTLYWTLWGTIFWITKLSVNVEYLIVEKYYGSFRSIAIKNIENFKDIPKKHFKT